jgi:hypothetical protein
MLSLGIASPLCFLAFQGLLLLDCSILAVRLQAGGVIGDGLLVMGNVYAEAHHTRSFRVF